MIVSGLMNALVSSINSRKSLAANAEQQELNRQWQDAQQQRQWRHAEMLQDKMREMTRQNFLAQLEQQRTSFDLQMLNQSWPLPSCPPNIIIKEINDYLSASEPVPLQLIVVENGDLSKGPLAIHHQVRNAINELNKFMSAHYGRNAAQSVKVYDTDRPGANFGAAEVSTLFQVFQLAPTIVLTSRVNGAEYVLECWYWGSGNAVRPVMAEIYRCNVDELQLEVLMNLAHGWINTKERLGIEDADKDYLVDLMGRIENEKQRLKTRGASPEEIREYSLKPFWGELSSFTTLASPKAGTNAPRVDARPFIRAINQGIESRILASFKICASLLCDAHFLLEQKASPKFMQICAQELAETPQLMSQAERFFDAALEALPDTSKADRAVMYARMAMAYQDTCRQEEAERCISLSSEQLQSMVDPESFALEASDEMNECVAELRQIRGAELIAPWINRCERVVSGDDLNRHAIGLFKKGRRREALDVWRRAGRQGHTKSMHNLTQVLEDEKKMEESREWGAKAILAGYEPLKSRSYDLAWWKCVRGDWVAAFLLWCAYLESEEKQHRDEAVACSSLILFTSALGKLTESDCEKWHRLVCCEGGNVPLSRDAVFSNYPSEAEAVLHAFSSCRGTGAAGKKTFLGLGSNMTKDDSNIFAAALAFWCRRSLNLTPTLFPGITDAERLVYQVAKGQPKDQMKVYDRIATEYEHQISLITKQYL